ncbi:MAG: hypothetical protein EXR77_11695 [Myxococcales bacterium]|nr:hypothetical protein [Myxococcales bacterium]
MKLLVVTIALVGVAWTSASAATAAPAVLESVSGDGVKLTRAGKVLAVDEGDELQQGDRLSVGSRGAVRLLFGDGTHLTLSARCEVELAKPLAGAAGVVVLKGNVAALVAKPPQPLAVKAGAVGDLRFFIKTNAAVMGVRGTEFVVEHHQASGHTDVHTLEGTVDVAQTDDDLGRGRGSRLGALERLRADKGGIGKPAQFERGAYFKDRAKHHRAASDLAKRAVRSRDDLRARLQARQGREGKARTYGHGAGGAKGDHPAEHRGQDKAGAPGKPEDRTQPDGKGKAAAGDDAGRGPKKAHAQPAEKGRDGPRTDDRRERHKGGGGRKGRD